jgi:hypothetical protein
MIDKRCPWCEAVQPASVTRVDLGRRYAEWRCSGCGMHWTVKDAHPGEAFVLWPDDVDAMLSPGSAEPLRIEGVDFSTAVFDHLHPRRDGLGPRGSGRPPGIDQEGQSDNVEVVAAAR